MAFVFQYGSNCDEKRLNSSKRLNGQAHDLCAAETVEGWKIAFEIYSVGNGCAASDLVQTPGTGRTAWGVLYEITDEFIRGKPIDGQKTLKEIEGKRYEEMPIRVRDDAGM